MSETINAFKEATIEFCYTLLKTDRDNQIEDKRVSDKVKLRAINKLKIYYVDNQKYEQAAFCREIEKELQS